MQVLDRANQYSDAIDALSAENEALRKKAGVPADARVDVAGVKGRAREEVRQLRALVTHLETELQEKEDVEMRLRWGWGWGVDGRAGGLHQRQRAFAQALLMLPIDSPEIHVRCVAD